jgi:amino acid permease
VVTGISLIFNAFGSRLWAAGSMAALLTYGLIGVVVLGVWIDAMLIVGALTLIRPAFATRQSRSSI